MSESLNALFMRDPEAANRRRRYALAEALQKQGTDTSPTVGTGNTTMQAIARVLQGGIGGLLGAHFDSEAKAEAEKNRAGAASWNPMAAALVGQTSGPAAPAPSPAPDLLGGAPPASQDPRPPIGEPQGTPAPVPQVQREGPGQYQPLIEAAAARNGIPPQIVAAVLRNESGGNPNAVGDQGHRNGPSRGLMQIQEATARQPGYGLQPVDPARLTDPATNINFGADYLAARGRAAGVTDWNDPAQQQRGLAAYSGAGPQAQAYGQRVAATVGQQPAPQPQGGPPQPAPMPQQGAPQPQASPQPAPAPQQAPQGLDMNAVAQRIAAGLNDPNPLIRRQAQAYAQMLPALRQQSDRAEDRTIRAGERTQDRDWRTQDIGAQRAFAMEQEQRQRAFQAEQAAQARAFQEQQQGRQLQQPPAGYRPTPDGGFQAVPGGPADPAQARALARARGEGTLPPQQITGAMLENVAAVRKIDQALGALTERGGQGVGIVAGLTPDAILNRTDPQGTGLRALIADIGSLKIHDRSGAAVSASEFPRLRPFIPAVSDSPATIRDKLTNFRREYEAMLRDQYSVYGPQGGGRALAPVEALLNPQQAPQGGNQGGGWSIRPVQ